VAYNAGGMALGLLSLALNATAVGGHAPQDA
jgi:hypothetical protein